jgi:Ca2+-binding RTX toxin-like protein
MITLNRADLDFLLRQVTINYLAPDSLNPGQFIPTTIFNYSALANAVDPSGLREVSGANNNLVGGYWDANTQTWVPGPNTTWGQANQPFLNQSVGQPVSSAPESAYNTPGGAVTDTDPRIISNLVATMFTTGPNANPAAADAATNSDPNAVFGGLQVNGQDTAFVANAGVLGGGRYNGWFVAFGQFFDHGLDFVLRDTDANAKITINLSPNDPLYDAANGVTSITVRRADVANSGDAGPDNTFGTIDDVGLVNPDGSLTLNGDESNFAKAQYINNTGLLIDQSQTYGSHASVNALIREYDANGNPTGRVVAGNTIDGPSASSGLATWADVEANALRIGVDLSDDPSHFTNPDVNDAPVLRTDPVGKLMFTPTDLDWATTDPWYKQILIDNPGFDTSTPFSYGLQSANDPFARDSAGSVLRTGQDMLIDFNPGQSLDSHIITGDGRANENIGLTAVHHVFHEEHNALVGNIQATIIAEYNAILASDGAAAATAFLAPWQSSPGVWDGEKLYQAARLITESEYNHIAIDQYVGTLYGALPEFVSYSSDINMGVSLEFSQAVFRLGHSMLTETFNVDVPNDPNDPNAGTHKLSLLEAFVNPELYASLGPQALTLGLTTTLGNEVDEFVTPALQQSLLGQPLDLATINITRGRDVGLPTWNEFRQQVYDLLIQNTNNTNGSALAPYTNWADVFDHLKNPLTGVNLIAAYAHDTGTFDWGIDEARAAYAAGTGTLDDMRNAAQALYDAYLNSADPNHAAAIEFMQGAPSYDPGTGQWTFTGADQGFWDIDLWIGGLAERPLFDGPLGTTFSYVILDFAQRQQDGDRFYYLFRTPMGTHLGNEIIENQFGNLVMDHTGLDHLNGEIFIWANKTFTLDDNPNYFNVATETILDVDGSPMPASAGHLIIAGLGGDDYLVAGLGDDTVYGDAGNDQIYGSQGNDHLFGGDGNDYIFDDENDDFISGGAGNDRIFAGPGALDTVFGDEGDDEIHGGDGIDELLGGTGDDMIYGDGDTDVLFGEEGNDYLEGGDSVDEMQGQEGNDWMRGGVGDDHLMGGDGNDLLEGGVGPTANDGDRMLGQGVLDFALTNPPDLGFDVASYEDVDIAITANLDTSNENGTGGLLDTYAGVEGLVGTRFNDSLTGADTDTITSNGPNNLLVGGAGDDILTGLGGDDFIAGDSVVVRNDLSVYLGPAAAYTTIVNWKGTGEDRPDFGVNGGLGHFLGDNGASGTSDKAVFSGAHTDYTITQNPDGTLRVVDNRGIDSTAAGDTVKDVEFFQFSDGTFAVADLNFAATGAPVISDLTPTEGQALTVNTASIADANGLGAFSYQWQALIGTNWTNIAGATGATFTPDNNPLQSFGDQAGRQLRVVVSFTDGGGNPESVTSAATGPVGVNWSSLVGATFNGTAGDDIATGSLFADILNGNAGDDSLSGFAGNDTIRGGAGNDVVAGGGGTDVAAYAGAAANFSFEVSGTTGILVTDTVGTEGVDTLSGIETLRFNGVNYAVVPGTTGNNANLNGATGTAGRQAVFGFAGSDSINGGAGNDIIHGGDGDDTITQTGATGGRDSVNGGVGNDTYVLNGVAGAETFRIYTRAAAIAAGMTIANTNTEIVVTRNGTTNAQIISELDNIEEITVNTLNVTTPGGAGGGATGGDTVIVIGDFTGTSLNFNTIIINGGNSDDMVDITGLTSDHRIVFHGAGGHNQVIGNLRPQDVVDGVTPSGPPHDPPGSDDQPGDMPVLPPVVQAGTAADDVLIGGADDDVISGVGGDDLVLGNSGDDTLKGGEGDDLIKGGAGNDIAFGNAGNDDVFGGVGQDMVFGDEGNDRLFGEDGNDIMEGGAGNDTVYTGSGDDRVLATVNDGDDVYWGEDGSDTVDYSAYTAGVKVDLGNGLLQHGSVASTQGGNDAVFGFENFIGGSGNDTIVASSVVNVMDGGSGNDTYVFKSAADANGDVINGFQPGDKIDLSGIDANAGFGGKQSFVLFAGTGFTAAGQLIVTHEIQDGVEHTIVAGSTNNDTVADFKIDVVGNHALATTDFHGVN